MGRLNVSEIVSASLFARRNRFKKNSTPSNYAINYTNRKFKPFYVYAV